MNYTVSDIFEATGRHLVGYDEWVYHLDPNKRYSHNTVNIMYNEYQYRVQEANILVDICRGVNIPVPRRRAMNMPINTPQLLQMALHRFREEVNRMTQRHQRWSFLQSANEKRKTNFWLNGKCICKKVMTRNINQTSICQMKIMFNTKRFQVMMRIAYVSKCMCVLRV